MSNISNSTANVLVNGTSAADSIRNSASGVTIHGAGGNDTLTGSSYAEVFRFRSDGGNDVITNFGTNDTLHIAAGKYNSYYSSGNDLIVQAKGASYSGTIRLLGAASQAIKLKDGGAALQTINTVNVISKIISNTTRNTVISGTSGADSIKNSARNVTINGNAGNDTIQTYGHSVKVDGGAGADSIKSTGGDYVTLHGGEGADTLTGSANGEVFQYRSDGGADVITNFGTNDTLHIAAGKYNSYYSSGNDLIVQAKGASYSGTIRLLGAASQAIKLKDGSTAVQTINTTTPSTAVNSPFNTVGNTILSGSSGADVIHNYASKVTLNGNAGNDTLTSFGDTISIDGGAGNDLLMNFGGERVTLHGGAGNDTLSGSSSGEVFVFGSNEGNDLIQNFGANDTLQIAVGSLNTYYVSGNNLIINLTGSSYNGYVTLQGAANIPIKLRTSSGLITINDTTGSNTIFNANRNKQVTGSSSADSIYNYAREVTINGASGNDSIISYGNAVSINGGAGNDSIHNTGGLEVTLSGGTGNDTLMGSSSGEMFVFGSSDGNDVLVNFAKNDTLYVSNGSLSSYRVNGEDLIVTINSTRVTLQGAAFMPVQVAYPTGVVETVTGYEKPDPDGVKAFVSETLSGAFYLNTYNQTANPKAVNIYAWTNKNNGLSLYGDDRANEIWGNNGYNWYDDCYIYGNKGNDVIRCGSSKDHVHYYYGDGNDTLYGYGSREDEIVLHDCSVSNIKVNDSSIIINLDSGASITLKDSLNKSVYIPGIGTDTFATYNVTNGKFAIPLGATGYFDMRHHTLSSESTLTKLDASANKSDGLTLYGDDRANEIWGNNGYNWYDDCYIYGNKGNDVIRCGSSKDHVHYYYGDGNDTLYGYGSREDEIVLHDCSVSNIKVNDSAIILNLDSGNSITLRDSFNGSIYIPGVGNQTFAEYKVTGNKYTIPLGASGYFDMRHHTLSSESTLTKLDASANKSDGLTLYGDDRANEIWGNNGYNWYDDCYIYGNKGNDVIRCGSSKDHVHYYYGDGNDTLYGYGSREDEIVLHDCSVSNVAVNDSAIILNLDSGNTITLKDSFGKSIYIPGIGNRTYTQPSNSELPASDPLDEYWFTHSDAQAVDELNSILSTDNVVNLDFDPIKDQFKPTSIDLIQTDSARSKLKK